MKRMKAVVSCLLLGITCTASAQVQFSRAELKAAFEEYSKDCVLLSVNTDEETGQPYYHYVNKALLNTSVSASSGTLADVSSLISGPLTYRCVLGIDVLFGPCGCNTNYPQFQYLMGCSPNMSKWPPTLVWDAPCSYSQTNPPSAGTLITWYWDQWGPSDYIQLATITMRCFYTNSPTKPLVW